MWFTKHKLSKVKNEQHTDYRIFTTRSLLLLISLELITRYELYKIAGERYRNSCRNVVLLGYPRWFSFPSRSADQVFNKIEISCSLVKIITCRHIWTRTFDSWLLPEMQKNYQRKITVRRLQLQGHLEMKCFS